MTSEKLIQDFNYGNYEKSIQPFFNDILSFLKYANKRGFIDDLLLDNIPNDEFEDALPYLEELGKVGDLDYDSVPDGFKNVLLLHQLENDPQETLNYVMKNLVTDVHLMNGGYYLLIRDRDEPAKLFRDGTARSYAEAVLGEDAWEPYYDTVNNVYDDVIDDLNEKNINNLSEYIIKHIGGEELSTDDYHNDLFHTFSDEQGTDGTFQITVENVMRLINDKTAMMEMLNGKLDVLKGELDSLHTNSYNGAYESEIYDDVWGELSRYFVPSSWETVTTERYDGKTVYNEYIKINDFQQVIYDFISTNKDYAQYNDGTLEYYGQYVDVIKAMMEDGGYSWLDFRTPDYPDWSLTKKYINDSFNDYI
jgi:hypothetical protein